MSFFHDNYSETDAQISQFARAIALPIRVFIIRRIVENGNALNKQALYTNAFNASAINKHIQELRSLGIVKINVVKTQVTYGVDMALFNQMSIRFNTLFNSAIQIPDDKQITAQPVVNPAPKKDHTIQHVPFGQYIKELRQELNMSQATLAAKINVDRGTLSRIECCKKDLTIDKLPMLSKALYVDIEALKKLYSNSSY